MGCDPVRHGRWHVPAQKLSGNWQWGFWSEGGTLGELGLCLSPGPPSQSCPHPSAIPLASASMGHGVSVLAVILQGGRDS